MDISLIVRHLGIQPYEETWQRMKTITADRDSTTPDEIWVLEHPSVFTQGQAGKAEHLLAPGDITVVKSDRGGQVTFHGPGQLVIYLLIDIRRLKMGARDLVTLIEKSVVGFLGKHDIQGVAKPEAPGVYVDERKVAALGLRIRRGCSYHGLSLNVNMDLEPFTRINPCGYQGLQVVDLHSLGLPMDIHGVAQEMIEILIRHFGYDARFVTEEGEAIANNGE